MSTLQENQSLNAEYERNKKEREMEEEIERLQEEIKGLNAELELYKDNQIHLINQLELKDNIIKEAREYTNDLLKLKENDYFDLVDKSYIKKYLEILDKVEEKK